jgi:hypothetical protein
MRVGEIQERRIFMREAAARAELGAHRWTRTDAACCYPRREMTIQNSGERNSGGNLAGKIDGEICNLLN